MTPRSAAPTPCTSARASPPCWRGSPATACAVILVETALRFARDILVQETGHRYLKELGVELIAANSPGAFLDDTPSAKLIRQLLGVISEFDKASTVARAGRRAEA
jgi:hypothetical protein